MPVKLDKFNAIGFIFKFQGLFKQLKNAICRHKKEECPAKLVKYILFPRARTIEGDVPQPDIFFSY
uniref:hypothetical protein n=1 Tax=Salmonella enterica TaxID=28901 RepID=UPI00329902D3